MMISVSRKQVENYYEKEWTDILSASTIKVLIELTCQSFNLNKPQVLEFNREKPIPALQNLGKI